MFITLQLPFIDLRPFLPDPPSRVPQRSPFPHSLHRDDLEKIVRKQEFVRSFGAFKLRGYVPKFHDKTARETFPPPGVLEDEEHWYNVQSFWKDEYLYVSARRGIRFQGLEQAPLIKDHVILPRVKIRALRLSHFLPAHPLWSPCIRVEIGILYSVPQQLEGEQLIRALNNFVGLKAYVPNYEKDGAGRTALISQPAELKARPLINQQDALAKLIVQATTAQRALKVHADMVVAGKPLLTVHYTPDELATLPDTFFPVSRSSVKYINIGYLPLPQPRIGAWLFEMPRTDPKQKNAAKKRVIIRNYSVAVMRYWAELQAMLALRRAICAEQFNFDVRNNDLLQHYVNKGTEILLSETKYGAKLNVIRNVMSAFRQADAEDYIETHHVFNEFRRQIVEKLIRISKTEAGIFVSYSHKNNVHLKSILQALSPLLSKKQIAYFDDTFIDAGTEWEKKILNQIDNSSIVILLVSEDFRRSEYINNIELPRIVERYQRGKTTILPILVSGEIPARGFLSSLQFLNPHIPLSRANDEELFSITSDLLQELRKCT